MARNRAQSILPFVAGFLVVIALRAEEPPNPQYSIEKITPDEWRAYLSEVQGMPKIQCENNGATNRYVCHRRTLSIEEVWVFTTEGNPAHPAASLGTLTQKHFCKPGYSGPNASITRFSRYAGDRTAFEVLLKQLVEGDARTLAKAEICSPSSGNP